MPRQQTTGSQIIVHFTLYFTHIHLPCIPEHTYTHKKQRKYQLFLTIYFQLTPRYSHGIGTDLLIVKICIELTPIGIILCITPFLQVDWLINNLYFRKMDPILKWDFIWLINTIITLYCNYTSDAFTSFTKLKAT